MFRAMKHVFIVNPAAGKSDRTESYRKLIDAAFVPRGLQYELLVSQAPGDCRKLAQQAAASGEEVRLYACGGDGTLNEVVNGVIGCPNAAVTHYPGGSGNDAIKIFDDPAAFTSIERLLSAEEAPFDLIRCNVCVLRGGKEAYRSAAAIVAAMHEGLREAGLPETFVNLVSDPTRRSAQELMTASGLVDLLIPRGGAGLIRACVESATVPCIETGTGICHVYVDKDADLEKALNIIENAKTSRPSVCNAEEVALVHRDVAGAFLPRLKARLVDARAAAGKIPVELRLDAAAQAIIPGTPAGERDFDTEFLDYILAVKVVSDADEAIRHIAAHSTHHSDAIVTENAQTAERFTRLVDSAAVYVNASTRFTDGGEFGLGCEMGISTQKLHARGPMGLRELTTYKYIVTGDGQTR